jgi:hypothetical protein
MLRCVALVGTDVSEERSPSIIRVTRICELRIFLRSMCQLLVTANIPSSPILLTLMMEALHSSVTPVLTRATRHDIPEDSIFHSHHRENFKSYKILISIYFWHIMYREIQKRKLALLTICW